MIVFEAVGLWCQLPKASGSGAAAVILSLLSLCRGATEANASFEDKMHMMGKHCAAEGSTKMFTCRDVLLPFRVRFLTLSCIKTRPDINVTCTNLQSEHGAA